jgi:flagellar biogenesis protein FliO
MRKKIVSTIILFFLGLYAVYGAAVSAPQAVKTDAAKSVSGKAADSGYLTSEFNNLENLNVPKAPGAIGSTLYILAVFLFVIGIFYLVMIALKFFYVRASIPLKSEGVLKVLAREYIDTKKVIYFVEAADRVLLLGSAGDNISTLAEITDKDTIEKIKLQADEYISKYRIKTETKFADELKAGYVKQGKKLVDAGNEAVKNIMEKFRKKP